MKTPFHVFVLVGLFAVAGVASMTLINYFALRSTTTRAGQSFSTSTTAGSAAKTPSPFDSVDDDVLGSAVLKRIGPVLNYGIVDAPLTREKINHQREQIVCLRAWANTLKSDARVRDEYLSWLDFFDQQVIRQQARFDQGDVAGDDERANAAEVAKQRRIAAIARALPSPEPCPIIK